MAHTDKRLVVTIKDDSSGDIVAIDQVPVDPKIGNNLIAKVEIVDTPPRARRAERNPLHPNALTLSDLKVGMRVKVNYTGDCPWARSYSAIVVGEPTTNDLGFRVVPIVTDDMEYKMGFVADMGLAPSRCGGVWNSVWYTMVAD